MPPPECKCPWVFSFLTMLLFITLLTGKEELELKAIRFKQCMFLPCELKFKHSGTCDNGFTVVLGGENFGSVPVRHNSQYEVTTRV